MVNITFRKSVLDDIRNYPPMDIIRILERIESTLAADPDYYPELKGVYKGIKRFKVGLYRILFSYKDEELEILKIGKRD